VLTQEERIEELWRRGRLRWKLFDDQKRVYDFIHSCPHKVVVINSTRQFGKSFIGATDAIEFANQTPEALIRYVAGTQKSLRKIVGPIFREIHRDCPADLRPHYDSGDTCWRFPDKAEIHVAAANDGHADDSRGQRAHRCYVEEAGFIDDLDYLVKSVLLPQTKTTGGKIILISTPPETPSHAFWSFYDRAMYRGAAITVTIDEDEHTPLAAKEELIEEMGGRQSTKARRELWCERIVDETRAICPEFDAERAVRLVYDAPAPTYEQPLVSLDLGWADKTGVLFGYYDFKRAKLVIQDELLLTRNRTDQIVQKAREKEAALWPAPKRPVMRVCDAPLLVLNDISTFHKWPVAAPMKDDLDAMVNELRLWTQADRLHIDPRCRGLVAQLQAAIWDTARRKFERTTDGHSDLVASLIYMIRTAPTHECPYPALAHDVSLATHHVDPSLMGTQAGNAARQLSKLFGRA
jgi:hypothetical protein